MPKATDSRPLHQQIAAELRAQIMSGDLAPGDQLPSTSQLVDQYGAANPTIQKAAGALKDEGFLRSRPGAGVYVRDRQPFIVDAANYLEPMPRGYAYQLIDVSEARPPADAAQQLGLGADELAAMRHRLLLHDDEPVEISWSFYPLDLAKGTPLARRPRIRGGAPRVLAELGWPQQRFTDRVSARQPTTAELEQLDLPADVPVIRQLRTIYSGDRPVEVSVLVKGAHRYELNYEQAIPEPPSA
ncbi:GntR family transcriptional regulator [Kutzneria sp. NPDC052558]|uniref:GntR family transcriptional regulator n=1 Tax=Kutzneria sp. NPDC052558 TaxID=3364121 RepID=UPI0037C6FF5E